ncbi:MAG: antitoxin VapB family protein [Thermoplasmata archaeon]|nr:antitoxin VapB family protein [Thermoplasmata archaeon]
MPSKTVSLEESAYERLKAAKGTDESFSEAVHRILADSRPSFRQLAGALSASEAEEVRAAVRKMRKQEAPGEDRRLNLWKKSRGSHPRH